jgi:hypothetical protein
MKEVFIYGRNTNDDDVEGQALVLGERGAGAHGSGRDGCLRDPRRAHEGVREHLDHVGGLHAERHRADSDKMLYRLETSSLMAISVSLNLSLLFNYFTVDSDPGVYYTVLTLIFIVNGVVLLAFVYGLAVASRTKLIALGKEYPAVFGPIARALFEDTVEALEMQVASKREERAALNQRLRRLMPRTYLLSDTLAGRMKEIRFAPDADRALAHYGSLLHTAAVRLERLPDPSAQLRELYDAERAVLAAELSATQAYRHEEFSNVLLRLEMM